MEKTKKVSQIELNELTSVKIDAIFDDIKISSDKAAYIFNLQHNINILCRKIQGIEEPKTIGISKQKKFDDKDFETFLKIRLSKIKEVVKQIPPDQAQIFLNNLLRELNRINKILSDERKKTTSQKQVNLSM